jgi:hypothetical protein
MAAAKRLTEERPQVTRRTFEISYLQLIFDAPPTPAGEFILLMVNPRI